MFGRVLKKLFRKKVVKLGLVGTSLLGLMISSGFSFAKYIDTNYGNGDAGAARFNVKISNNTKFIYLPTMGGTDTPYGYYAFVAEFSVDFSECEVKTKYNLGLKLCGRYSTNYTSPEYKAKQTYFCLTNFNKGIYTAVGKVNEMSTIVTTDVEKTVTDGKYEEFSTYTLYYAKSKDGTNYTWDDLSITNTQEIKFTNETSNPLEIQYYKIVYFTTIDWSGTEISIILSNLEVEQVV